MAVTIATLRADTLTILNEASNSVIGDYANGTGGVTTSTQDTIDAYLNEAQAEMARACVFIPGTYTTGATTWVPSPLTATTVQYIGYLPNSTFHYIDASMDIFSPFVSADGTSVVGQFSGLSSGAAFAGGQIMGKMNVAGQYRGLRFDNGGAGNMTGTVTVYGSKA